MDALVSPEALSRLLRATASQPPLNPLLDNGPWDFLLRQPPDDLASHVRPVVHELLTDADPDVRRQALSLLTNLPSDPQSIQRIFDAAHQTRLFQTPALLVAMGQALSTFVIASGRGRDAASLLRALIDTRVPPPGTATVLALHEPAYAAAQAVLHGDAAGPFVAQVAAVFAGYQRDRLLSYARSIAGLSVGTRDDAWQRMQLFLALSPERVAQLAASEGIAPPTDAAPTAQQVKRALGL